MNSLLHNPVIELALPYFLVAFAAFEVIALIAGGVWIWLCDGTRDDDLPDAYPSLANSCCRFLVTKCPTGSALVTSR